MQTFLPYPSFIQSAVALDWRRLGKQRSEAKQIYLALTQPGYGWQNHPAVKMWKGYEESLAMYGWTICQEWIKRGYNDNLTPWFAVRIPHVHTPEHMYSMPPWIGNDAFHLSHQSNLIRKSPPCSHRRKRQIRHENPPPS